MEEEVSLRDYLLILISKWWLILLTFIAAIGGAAGYSFRLPDEYETHSRLLIIPRVAERLVNEREIVTVEASLSVETLKNLAEANDLLAEVIKELDLRDPATGQLLPVESLAAMTEAKAEMMGRGQAQSPLPLLTMTVRGKDPGLIKKIADKWAELFIQRNSQFFVTEAARSFEFIRTQYEEVGKSLRAKQQEKLAYQKANPLALLQSELKVTTAHYEEFLSRLQSSRAALVEAQARLQSLSPRLSQEPVFLQLRKSIPEESFFILLGNNVSVDQLQTLGRVELIDEVLNPAYLDLKAQLSQAQIDVSTYEAVIADLEIRTAQFEERIRQLSERIAVIQTELSHFDQDIGVLSGNLNQLAHSLQEAQIARAEQEGTIRLVEKAIVPQVAVSPNRRLNVLIGGMLGLFSGVVLAFFVHSIQRPPAIREKAGT